MKLFNEPAYRHHTPRSVDHWVPVKRACCQSVGVFTCIA